MPGGFRLESSSARGHNGAERKNDAPDGRWPPSLATQYSLWLDRNFHRVLPATSVTVVTALLTFPFLYTLYMSLHRYRIGLGTPTFVGVSNFLTIIFADPRFWNSLRVTAEFTAIAVACELVGGLFLALLLNREYFFKGLIRTILVFSMASTPVAVALVWTLMFNPTLGVLNHLRGLLGLAPALWTSDPGSVILSLALVDIWQWTPFMFLVIQAALQTLPEEPFEAALIDGASSTQQFFYITLPLIRPSMIVALMFRMIDCLKTFDIIYVITGGGPGIASENLNIYTFKQAFVFFDLGYGSALLTLLFLVVLTMALLLMQARRRRWAL
jgi:multiple sugar transport system permease protein